MEINNVNIPSEIIISICELLDLKSIYNLIITCKIIFEIINDDYLWKSILMNLLNEKKENYGIIKDNNYKNTFKKYHKLSLFRESNKESYIGKYRLSKIYSKIKINFEFKNDIHERLKYIDVLENLRFLFVHKFENRINLDDVIETIPDSIYSMKNLNGLTIWNTTNFISDDISKLENLRILDLTQNQLEKIPNNICKLSKLERLYLNHNKLVDLPDELGQLENLVRLNICDNQLREIPKGIYQLQNLRDLEIRDNQIESISIEIQKLDKLTYLDISNNKLTDIDTLIRAINNMPNLTALFLGGNNLATQPKLGQFKNLIYLGT